MVNLGGPTIVRKLETLNQCWANVGPSSTMPENTKS